MKIKILQIIDTLNIGGVERALVGLASALNKDKFEVYLLPLLEKGQLIEEARRPGIELINLRAKNRFDPGCAIALYQLIKKMGIQIVHTHLVSSDLIGGLAGRLARESA